MKYYLRNSQQGGFEGGCTRSDNRGFGIPEQVVGRVKNYRDFTAFQIREIVVGGECWSPGNDELEIREAIRGFDHFRQNTVKFLFPGARQKGNHRPDIQIMIDFKLVVRDTLSNGIEYWISHIVYVHPPAFIEINLEGQNAKHLVDALFYFQNPFLVPCPNLGRDVIKHLYVFLPGIKGRTIGKEIAPWGQVWRTGANEATVFEVSKNVTIAGKTLPKGKYSLYSIPGQKEFVIILNKTWNQSGTEYDKKSDVLRFTAKTLKAPAFSERMTFKIAKTGVVSLIWGNYMVNFTVK